MVLTMGSRCAGLLLAFATVWLVYDRPVARIEVAAVLAACMLAQLRWADAWLIFVPALLPVFDLTLWSGRLYVNEFDLLVLATAAAHFMRAPYRHQFPRFAGQGGVVIAILLAWFAVAALLGALPLPRPDANQLGSYLSNYNALRVAKSMVAGLLLLAPLQAALARDRARAGEWLILGTSIGLGLVGLVVLWERNVLLALVQSGGHLYAHRYEILGALLDFTWDHRATALFSEMHTGGEAIDTYLALAPPIAAAGVLALQRPVLRLFCLGALCLGIYAVVATFSRGLYFGFGSAMAVVLLLSAFTSRQRFRSKFSGVRIVVGMAAALAILAISYSQGGFAALAAALLIAGVGIISGLLMGESWPWLAAAVLCLLSAVGTFLFAHAFINSHYNTLGPTTAWPFAALLSVTLNGATALAAVRTILPRDRGSAFVVVLFFATVASIAIPAAGGTRMIGRFSESSEDALGRWEHWREAWRFIGPDWQHYAFGMGVGRYPQLYFRRGTEEELSANYRFGADQSRTWLEWGSGDFTMTQKIPLQPFTKYVLDLSVRSKSPNARLAVYICPRLILYSKGDEPECLPFSFPAQPDDTWTAHEVSFDSGTLGSLGLLGWPITFLLHNDIENSVIEITDLRLSDGGPSIIANGNFAAGGDRWITIDDIEHLPMHIKNLYLEVFFEAGAVGLCVFLMALAIAFVRANRAARRQEALGIGVTGSLVAFAVVGVVGSLFDNPRPATLFFILLFWALQSARRRRGQQESHSGGVFKSGSALS